MKLYGWLHLVANGSATFMGAGLVLLMLGEERVRRVRVDWVIWVGVVLTIVLIGSACVGVGVEHY